MTPEPSTDAGRVLVVGAAGRHGSTGRVVLEELRAAGVVVRAFARTDDDRAASLRAKGDSTITRTGGLRSGPTPRRMQAMWAKRGN